MYLLEIKKPLKDKELEYLLSLNNFKTIELSNLEIIKKIRQEVLNKLNNIKYFKKTLKKIDPKDIVNKEFDKLLEALKTGDKEPYDLIGDLARKISTVGYGRQLINSNTMDILLSVSTDQISKNKKDTKPDLNINDFQKDIENLNNIYIEINKKYNIKVPNLKIEIDKLKSLSPHMKKDDNNYISIIKEINNQVIKYNRDIDKALRNYDQDTSSIEKRFKSSKEIYYKNLSLSSISTKISKNIVNKKHRENKLEYNKLFDKFKTIKPKETTVKNFKELLILLNSKDNYVYDYIEKNKDTILKNPLISITLNSDNLGIKEDKQSRLSNIYKILKENKPINLLLNDTLSIDVEKEIKKCLNININNNILDELSKLYNKYKEEFKINKPNILFKMILNSYVDGGFNEDKLLEFKSVYDTSYSNLSDDNKSTLLDLNDTWLKWSLVHKKEIKHKIFLVSGVNPTTFDFSDFNNFLKETSNNNLSLNKFDIAIYQFMKLKDGYVSIDEFYNTRKKLTMEEKINVVYLHVLNISPKNKNIFKLEDLKELYDNSKQTEKLIDMSYDELSDLLMF